jgi:D-apiose dehydrogenase
MRVAIAGAGFWARYQIAAWRELPGIELVGVMDVDRGRAEAIASQFQIPFVASDPDELLDRSRADLLDVITSPETHAAWVERAAARRLPVVSQKPMTPSLQASEQLVARCQSQQSFFAVHENWRWQSPIRVAKQWIENGEIGDPFRARIDFMTAFDVGANQPFLRTVQRYVIADIGCHLIDASRAMMGEVDRVHAWTRRIQSNVVGEDIATILLEMNGGKLLTHIHIGYGCVPMADDPFPETIAVIEGSEGTLRIDRGYRVSVVNRQGSKRHVATPPQYGWVHPQYAVVQSSIVECHRDIVAALTRGERCENDASDNLVTMRVVEAAYQSAATGQPVDLCMMGS